MSHHHHEEKHHHEHEEKHDKHHKNHHEDERYERREEEYRYNVNIHQHSAALDVSVGFIQGVSSLGFTSFYFLMAKMARLSQLIRNWLML